VGPVINLISSIHIYKTLRLFHHVDAEGGMARGGGLAALELLVNIIVGKDGLQMLIAVVFVCDKYRVLATLQAGRKNFKVPILAQIQLLNVFPISKKLNLFYGSGCLLALKNKQKKLSYSCQYGNPEIFVVCSLYIYHHSGCLISLE